MSEEKQQLRAQARKHRERMDPFSEDVDEAARYFFEAVQPPQDKIVAAYWPKGRECDPSPILDGLLKQGVRCALPVVQKDTRVLTFVRWDESTQLKKGAFGIMEPDSSEVVEPDIVIVPMLAFDRYGTRLGQGGGYYDATLADLRDKKDILAVGLAYAQQAVLFKLPAESHDQKLDWVITPQGTHYFGEQE